MLRKFRNCVVFCCPDILDSIMNWELLGLDSSTIDYKSDLQQECLPEFIGGYLKDILDMLSVNSDYETIFYLSDVVVEYSWEKLNTNLWMCVDDKWRYLYGYATLYKTIGLYSMDKVNVNTDELIKLCDLGLLMSGPLLEKQFNTIIKCVSEMDNARPSLPKRSKLDDESIKPENPYINPKLSIPLEYSPSVDLFKKNYFLTNKPLIIDGQMNHWPAITKWNIDYIRQVAGRRTVPVEIGSKYTEENWSQKLMTIDNFIDKFILNNQSSGYLAQHPLFDQVFPRTTQPNKDKNID
jgi:lysine-specific demethylase 8